MPSTSTQSPAENSQLDPWQLIWRALPVYARSRVEAELPPGERPPFVAFVIDPIEADAVTQRPSLRSSALLDSGLVIHALTDPKILAMPEAIRLARAAIKLDPRLDARLLSHLTRADRHWPDEVPESEIAHVLEVLDSISDCRRLIMPLMKFMKLPQKHLRSKVVKLIARASQNSGWTEMLLSDPDPRVRANLVEGIASQNSPSIEDFLRRAAKDPHHRVSVTAMLELCRRNLEPGCEAIRKFAIEGDDAYRCAAEWALRQLESKPQPESKPADPAPAAESKPADSAPAAESKPAEPASNTAPATESK